MNLLNGVRKMVRNFLRISDNSTNIMSLIKNKSEDTQLESYKLWYNGDADLLNQFYQSMVNQELNFWGVVPSVGLEIPKKHSGVPKVLVDTFSNMVSKDLNEIIIEDDKQSKIWGKVAKFNDFKHLSNEIIKGSLAIGDGAVKIIQNSIFDEPILQFVDGCNVKYERKYGKITEIIFYQYYEKNNKQYILEEHYGIGDIHNILKDSDDNQVKLNIIPELKEMQEEIILNNKFIYAVPFFLLGMDSEFPERGKSLFSGKIDSFDGLDEVISLLEQAIRDGRVKTYIPESCIPRDPETGELLLFNNSFDTQFIKLDNNLSETGQSRIDVQQPEINTDQYMTAYNLYFNLICLGVIAPCSLGVEDDKLNNNSVAQKEKEKVTIITRNQIIENFSNSLKELIYKVLTIKGENADIDKISISFNSYQSPCFEARLDAMSKASQYGVISARTQVNELYGDDFTEEFKTKETIMLMIEKGTLNKTNLKILKELDQIKLDDNTYNSILNVLEEQSTEEMVSAKGPGQDATGSNFKQFEKSSLTKYY
jgi:hypothetical protein